jgi:inosose dehydratase
MAFSSDMVAGQVYVWMQHYSAQQQRLEDHFADVLDDLQAAGYTAIEGWLQWFENPDQSKRMLGELKARDMRIIQLYTGGTLHEATTSDQTVGKIVETARKAATSGCAILNANPDPIDWRQPLDKTDEQLSVQADALNRLAAEIAPLGMILTVHQHDAEMRHDAHEFYFDLKQTDPERVFFCLDFDWVSKGGQDPHHLLQDAGTRVRSTHLRNNRGGVWLEALEDGDVDYRRICAQLQQFDYSGPLIVELATMDRTVTTRSLRENMRHSREYVRQVFGV